MNKPDLDTLMHIGVKRKSGRYPWGSGENPYQSENWFLPQYEALREQGLNEKQIAEKLGMNTTELRNNITWARREERQFLTSEVNRLANEGFNNVEIGKKLNISEKTVRNYRSNEQPPSQKQWDNIN